MTASETGERIGLYPGTFDPVTLGHADIIRRGAKLVKEIALFGGDVAPFVSPAVREQVIARVAQLGRRGTL